MSIFDTGGSAKSRWRARGGTATGIICGRRRSRWQTQPSNLDWAQFLGPVKWRDYDPQQYYNWRAYLDFGGGQVTDLFTHWIDAVHMFMGRTIRFSAAAAGGVYNYKDGRTAPDTINVLLQYPTELDGDVRGDARAGDRRRGDRDVRDRRAAVDRPRPVRVHPVGRARSR
jgi:hypothetical protein